MAKLYLIVFESEYYSMEAEWFFKVSEERITQDQAEKLAKEFILDNQDDEDPEEVDIENCWVNEVTKEDGYNIIVVKE